MRLHCIIHISPCNTLQMFKPLTPQSCFILNGSPLPHFIFVPTTLATHNDMHLTKECWSTLLHDLYHCDYTVNGSFFVNILDCSFDEWLRLWKEETIASCQSGWHSTPVGPMCWCVYWMTSKKTSSDCKLLCFNTQVMYWYSLNNCSKSKN